MTYPSIARQKASFVALAGIAAGLIAASAAGAQQGGQPPDFTRLGAEPAGPGNAPRSMRANETMIPVQAGTYVLGRDDGPDSERPAHSVELPGFRIDRTEVTNAAFAEYLNALAIPVAQAFDGGQASRTNLSDESAVLLMEEQRGGGLYPIIALDDPQARIGYSGGAFVPNPGYADHPVTETTWAGARAYCIWRGARLPTEAEWEAAARGAEANLYPWGNAAPDRTRAFVSRQTGVTAPVGSHPAGATAAGVQDMSGSLAEWTSSLKRPYPYDPLDGREAPDRAGERVTRGGDYIYDADAATLTATHRDGFSNAPGRGHRHIGFRCAADTGAG